MVRFLRKHAPLPILPATLGLGAQLGRAVLHLSWDDWWGTLRGWWEGWRESLRRDA